MSEIKTIKVTIRLLSDAIFGSGHSVPGGEDIAVCTDDNGYPYIRGSTFKGLLRESCENLLCWRGEDESIAAQLFGQADRYSAVGQRIHLTDFRVTGSKENCFSTRTFTSIENGVAKQGTLRTTMCVCKGLEFEGYITCAGEHVNLLSDALKGVKWAGTMRSRGFGRIAVFPKVMNTDEKTFTPKAGGTGCIHYCLHTELPVMITELSRSKENNLETNNFIPGSAVRGMVISRIAANHSEWFEKNKHLLLSDKTRFLDVFPSMPSNEEYKGSNAPIPSVKGFYEDKGETVFESVVVDGTFSPGSKRARMGSFCALDDTTIRYWSAKTGSTMRIQRNTRSVEDSLPFQTRYISAGQNFEGYILLDEPELAEKIYEAFSDTVWLGADRYEGFGKCSVSFPDTDSSEPRYITQYSCASAGDECLGDVLYMLTISPFTFIDETGEPCGMDCKKLASLLGVDKVTIEFCSTTIVQSSHFNSTWGCRSAAIPLYDRGSIFKLRCSSAPSSKAVRAIETRGIGTRRAEGLGRVIFLDRDRFEAISSKADARNTKIKPTDRSSIIRRARIRWIMDNVSRIGTLSDSQLGDIQAECEQVLISANTKKLYSLLKKNLTERGTAHGELYKELNDLINSVAEKRLCDTLGIEDDLAQEDNTKARFRLLCDLFDYQRKGS